MEKYILEQDIPVVYVAAREVPEGIGAAILEMEACLKADAGNRIFYGVSGCRNGEMFYWAAANEARPGEAEQLGCRRFTIPAGRYLAKTVRNFREDIQQIKRTFEELLDQPGLQTGGLCVEIYINDDDVRCLVQIDDAVGRQS
ncbi:transcriptional regulator [Pedobacter yulinensis]|uniref:Transcriptional regulator n=1 Tax=Pedobacter yulinensis TaxID=2126353 RepID=A0A2T3HJI8_9SPHI|nr:GyrI-like domain-containing protein [Pedobacter yulinensis]PST82604.1 transcriptional regulator [Pedobacter yulinensis]